MQMGLVNELQNAIDTDETGALLRRAYRVAAKLQRTEIAEWLSNEQNGYGPGAVPDFRVLNGTLHYRTNGYIPAGFGMAKNGAFSMPPMKGIDCSQMPIREPIAQVIEQITAVKSGHLITMQLSADINRSLRKLFHSEFFPEIIEQFTFEVHLDPAKLTAIPSRIRDLLLRWACDLETAGVLGEGMSMTDREKDLAKQVVFNINNCTIEQLSDSGLNWKR